MSPPSNSSPTRSWRDAVLGHTAPRPESDSPLAPGRLSYMESPDHSSRIRRPVHHATPPTAGRPPPSIRQRLSVFDDCCADTNNNVVGPPNIFPPTKRDTSTLPVVGTPVPTFDPPAPLSTLTSVGDAPSTSSGGPFAGDNEPSSMRIVSQTSQSDDHTPRTIDGDDDGELYDSDDDSDVEGDDATDEDNITDGDRGGSGHTNGPVDAEDDRADNTTNETRANRPKARKADNRRRVLGTHFHPFLRPVNIKRLSRLHVEDVIKTSEGDTLYLFFRYVPDVLNMHEFNGKILHIAEKQREAGTGGEVVKISTDKYVCLRATVTNDTQRHAV